MLQRLFPPTVIALHTPLAQSPPLVHKSSMGLVAEPPAPPLVAVLVAVAPPVAALLLDAPAPPTLAFPLLVTPCDAPPAPPTAELLLPSHWPLALHA
jgi:hypothetical protein